jgi:hypothetical protein
MLGSGMKRSFCALFLVSFWKIFEEGEITMKTSNYLFILVGLTALFILFCPSWAVGQTEWSIESSATLLGEYSSPPGGCAPPLPPYAVLTPPAPLPGCPPLIPFPFLCELGGSAVDNDGNFLSGGPAAPAMLHTDGFTVEMVDTTTGAYLMSWFVGGVSLPGPISGLGYDSAGDIIWVTDGILCCGLIPLPSCTAPLPYAVPPFPLPLIGGPASGLDWDPCTGTVWFSDCGGFVVNSTIAGGLVSFFPAAPPLTPLLTGLTVNTATIPVAGASPNLQVTDGVTFAEFTSGGALAAPGPFYLAANPYPIPLFGFPVSGVGFSLRPVNYGVGCAGPTGVTPSIGFTGGYPFVGNAGFSITMTGGTPGAFSYLVADVSAACPALSLPGCPGSVWVAFPWLLMIPLGPVPATGSWTIPAPIPPAPGPCGPNVGVPVFAQFINVISVGPTVVETSDALSFTIGDACSILMHESHTPPGWSDRPGGFFCCMNSRFPEARQNGIFLKQGKAKERLDDTGIFTI